MHGARDGIGVPGAREWSAPGAVQGPPPFKNGAGNGIRTRDFDLGKVALYH